MSNNRELADLISQAGGTSEGVLAGRRNLIINGAMQVAQRGTSFGTLGSQAYTLDRWKVDSGVTVSQTSVDVADRSLAGNCTKAISIQAPDGTRYWRQYVEDVEKFSDVTLTLSFYAKGASATSINNIYARQIMGTGTFVDTAFTANSFSVTTGYTRYAGTVTLPSLSGYTIGTGSCLEVFMNLPNNVNVHITGVQLELGSVATPFEHRSYGEELALCQRYYEAGEISRVYQAGSTGWTAQLVTYMQEKRATPSFAFTDFSGVSNRIQVNDNNTTTTSCQIATNTMTPTKIFRMLRTQPSGDGEYIGFRWYADAEL